MDSSLRIFAITFIMAMIIFSHGMADGIDYKKSKPHSKPNTKPPCPPNEVYNKGFGDCQYMGETCNDDCVVNTYKGGHCYKHHICCCYTKT
ncbi:hypothetical protein CASFOL_038208 [Castilleja foliolosa]|uniref:Uncharacterized protein n=1 Tax=Castilleja foliolosa TaxID=1961234 RepID=A0ABD3BKT8_9LAMI